jgi:hypothetical protein
MQVLDSISPWTFALLLAALGCSPTVDKGDSGTSDDGGDIDSDVADEGGDPGGGAGGGSGGGSGGSGGPDPSQVPQVLDADIWCYEHSTGEIRYIWSMVATFTDPQGEPTIQPLYEGLSAWQGSGLLGTYAVVCSTGGTCTASFEEIENNVLCSSASSYRFMLEVRDEDGNLSAPYEMTGRVGSDASGR